MCRVKAPSVPCGECQANRLNAIHAKLDKLFNDEPDSVKTKLCQAFDLGRSVHITK